MDTRKWKKVLLQWITECAFMEHNYFNIEQTDIETFFQNYCLHLHYKGIGADLADGCVDLATFLQEYYPDFTPHFDDNYALSSADYVYVYSLLLHFSCVKYPEEYFHDICQKLSEQSQRSIAAFFKLVIDCNKISKETIRHAIAEITQSSPNSGNESYSSGSGCTSSQSPNFAAPSESLVKTPKRPPPTQRTSPSTPKSFLLQERTRELYNLRALLETERYEKGLLEVQIKQNEEKILKLNHDHRKLQLQIQELKNDILTKNTENIDTPKKDGDEQIKRRLCKEISQKEQEISKLTDILSNLREEKSLLQEKLTYAEKQIVICMNRIKELDYKLDELSAELEQKNGTIKYLTNNKLELEQFIAETRAAQNSARSDLSASFDGLDSSFSRASNSSSSQSSPENLARSVIDVQLREKECENLQLRAELANLRVGNNRLAKHIHQTVQRHAEEWQLNIEDITVNDDEYVDPAEHFILFSDCVDKLCKRYKNEQNTVKKLQQDALITKKQNASMYQRVQQFEKDVGDMKACIQSADKLNKELDKAKKKLEEKLLACEEELKLVNEQGLKTVDNFNKLCKEYEGHRVSCELMKKEFNNELSTLKNNLLSQIERSETLEERNQQLDEMNSDLKSKLDALYENLKSTTREYEGEVKSFIERLDSKEEQLKTHASAEVLVKDKYEKLLIACEDMKRSSREADQYLEAMRNEINVKELEMEKVGLEIIELHKKNAELEERIDTLLETHKHELHSSGNAINKKEELLQLMNSENNKLKHQLEDVKKLHSLNRVETELIQKELQATTCKLATLQMLLKSADEEETSEDENHQTETNNVLDEVIERVKQLLQLKTNDYARIECLENEIMQLKTQLRDSEESLKNVTSEKEKIIEEYNNIILECKNEIQLAEERILSYKTMIEELQQKQNSFIENMEKQLHNTQKQEENLEQQNQLHQDQLQQLEKERKAETADYARLEKKLTSVIDEHNSVKSKLLEAENEITQLQEDRYAIKIDHAEKINEFSEKMQRLEEENLRLLTDINNFKKEHVRVESLLEKANTALEELSGKLSLETTSKSELSLKLQQNDKHLLETEKKLQSILEEKSSSLNKLQSSYEEQMECVKKTSAKIERLEQLKNAQAEEIEDLKSEVKRLMKAKEEHQEIYAKDSQQLEIEQSEKAMLLRSLEETADQLKKILYENAEQTKLFNQRCTDLEAQYTRASKMNERLQSQMASRETEWTLQLDEIEIERADMQSKLMRKIAEQAEQQESDKLSLIETITVLENIGKTNLEQLLAEPNIFHVSDGGDDAPHFNQLKLLLNKFMRQLGQLQHQTDETNRKYKEAAEYVEVLTTTNVKLNTQLKRNKSEITNLQGLLANDSKSEESVLRNEVKRLKDDLTSMACVNEKLSNDNDEFQYKLTSIEDELANAKLTVDILTGEQKKLLQKITNTQHTQSLYKNEIDEKTEKICRVEEELQVANASVSKLKKQASKIQVKSSSTINETRELSEKLRSLQKEHELLQAESTRNKREFASMQKKLQEASVERSRLEDQCRAAAVRLDEAIEKRLASDSKYDALNLNMQQLQRDSCLKEQQLQSAQEEQKKLSHDIETLRREKEVFNDELKEAKRELQRALDNVSELIQQIASIRLEKESIAEENQLLRKQLDENGKCQSNSESKIKAIVERSQSLELALLTAENDLKSTKANLEKCEQDSEKLRQNNNKLREAHEVATKRIEKMALKLGDVQARNSKLERDIDKLTKINEANNTSLEASQREKESLQGEVKSLKERLSRSERTYEQLTIKLQTLEKTNAELQATKIKLEAAELEVKSKMLKFEKMRDTNEEKIRKLNQALNNSEQTNVRLNLEIGALNSQFSEVRRIASEERMEEKEDIQKKLLEAEELAEQYKKRCLQLEAQAEQLRAENEDVSDHLSKVTLSLQIMKEKCDSLFKEQGQLREDLEESRALIERSNLQHSAALKQQEAGHKTQLDEQHSIVVELKAKMSQMQTELDEKCANFVELEAEVENLRESLTKNQDTIGEVENLRTRLSIAEELLEKEQNTMAQLRTDNQILQAKYKEAKQRLIDENKLSEDRIKENRLELEGKLEKMKNKMKSLYTEEIAKMKAKQERENAGLKSDFEMLKAKNKKYEELISKLSSQIVRLNDNILEYKTQNTILNSKLKHMEEQRDFKRPSSVHVATSATSLAALPTCAASSSSANMGSNLAMEDEEGELFNNTYLADLKNGRMSDILSRNICPEELQYRNSLLPPHLQSTYAAQYDHGLMDDDSKDGPHSLDDSMSALLSSTVGGTRKKISGATLYKRPGPPTPSKNGGRLSFGGNSEPPREILKESYDNNSAAVISSAKTPVRFKMFSSRFSMGNSCIKDESVRLDLRKAVHTKNIQLIHKSAAGAVCTSTPRKSKAHFDQRRLLDHMLKSSPSSSSPIILSPLVSKQENPSEGNENSLGKTRRLSNRQQHLQVLRHRNRRSSLLKNSRRCQPSNKYVADATKVQLKVVEAASQHPHPHPLELVCGCSSGTTSSECPSASLLQRRLQRRSKRARPSLSMRGNIFAKHRTPSRGYAALYRDAIRKKARNQRLENFNNYRMLKVNLKQEQQSRDEGGEDEGRKSSTTNNNNYTNTDCNHNPLGTTMVIVKKEPLQNVEDAATFLKDHDDDDFVDVEDDPDDHFEGTDYLDDEEDEAFGDDDGDFNDLAEDDGEDVENTSAATQNCTIHAENRPLVTTLDLLEFDKRNALQQSGEGSEGSTALANSKYFEQLLAETESHAPFEVKKLQFELKTETQITKPPETIKTSITTSAPAARAVATISANNNIAKTSETATTSATAPSFMSESVSASVGVQNSPSNNSSLYNSRTIYGASVIYNRKLPNVNTTYARKSSIYIKQKDPDEDIILVTNQTITLMDLARMWTQMDNATRFVLGFVLLASLITVVGVALTFFYTR